jgi:hypothetical protein
MFYLNRLEDVTKTSREKLITLNYGNFFDAHCLVASEQLYNKIALTLEDIKNYREIIGSVSYLE